MSEQPFTVSIPEEKQELLHKKLALTTLPDELEDSGWDYGVPLADIRRLVQHWQHSFDWRAQERTINDALPQFTRNIEVEGHGAFNIHYAHTRSAVANAIPLCFVHGWPGSFLEALHITPLLVKPHSSESPAFHVVALSVPGYGFSEAPRKKAFGAEQYAEVAHKLMLSLGYNEYVTQGGDWGYRVTRRMASTYGPEHVKAWHTNFPQGTPTEEEKAKPISAYSEYDQEALRKTQDWIENETGYSSIHRTKPQTLAYSLTDSPVGLLAWIYEKIVSWTDNYPWTDDEVLTWVSIYWFSRAGPAATIRPYYEIAQSQTGSNYVTNPTVPLGYSFFPKELTRQPLEWANREGNVVFSRIHEKGGHFAAHEMPEALVQDLRDMFGKGGPAFGVVDGKNGYVV
ncbi:Alpha/Beta hydrolase protein [Schizophyllum amplum]|uniref:Alpha/Beta hydrolase protein n=1 Tax=Schizophyllum amplum TaxID=97359 RepID=A0A550CKR7_9AGAR|nr:Alpha/Beta hydrolase protein [Auriculariopsis ampla]